MDRLRVSLISISDLPGDIYIYIFHPRIKSSNHKRITYPIARSISTAYIYLTTMELTKVKTVEIPKKTAKSEPNSPTNCQRKHTNTNNNNEMHEYEPNTQSVFDQ